MAAGGVLLVLHVDSRLPLDAHPAIVPATRAGAVGGNFVLRLDGDDPFAAALTRVYALQRRAGLYYGDSSVWVTRRPGTRSGGSASWRS